MTPDEALGNLRAARVRLFEACQRRDALMGRRPIPLDRVAALNDEIATLRDEVQTAREAAQSLFEG